MINKNIFFSICLFCTLVGTSLTSSGNQKQAKNIWKPIGPGFANVVSHAQYYNNDLFLLIDIGGLVKYDFKNKTWTYLTYYSDTGITSRRFNHFDINPNDSNEIIIAADGLFKSTDSGQTWSPLTTGLPSSKYGKRINSYGLIKYSLDGKMIFTGVGTRNFMPVKNIEQALSKSHTIKSIYISNDGGASFTKSIIDQSEFSVIKEIYPHPIDKNILYLSFDDGTFYISKNASQDLKSISFEKIEVPNGYFINDITVSKKPGGETFVSIKKIEDNSSSKILKLTDVLSSKPMFKEIPLSFSLNYFKFKVLNDEIMSINFQNTDEKILIIGLRNNPDLVKLDIENGELHYVSLPEQEYKTFGNFYGSIERFFAGGDNQNLVVSKTGAWLVDHSFTSFKSLFMKKVPNGYTNTGVSAIGNVNTLSITENNIFAGTYDHSAWRINKTTFESEYFGNKIESKYRFSDISWIGTNLYASNDEKFIILEEAKRDNKFKGHHWFQDKKYFVSKNEGDTWVNITENLSKTDVFSGGSELIKIIFDPNSSKRQWWLFSNTLYYTDDGCESFKVINKLDEKIEFSVYFADIFYDHQQDIIYLAISMKDRHVNDKYVETNSQGPGLFLTLNNGSNWSRAINNNINIKSVALHKNSLILGTMKSETEPGKLIFVSLKNFGMPKTIVTVGTEQTELMSNQTSFWPVLSNNRYIVAYSNINWILNDKFFARGPLISIDDGKTFLPITFNLPNTNIYSADLDDDMIVLGTTLGIMYATIDDIISELDDLSTSLNIKK